MNKIIVKWFKADPITGYDTEMIVMYSTHKRFITGSRFDYGFASVASKEGYIIEILPL